MIIVKIYSLNKQFYCCPCHAVRNIDGIIGCNLHFWVNQLGRHYCIIIWERKLQDDRKHVRGEHSGLLFRIIRGDANRKVAGFYDPIKRFLLSFAFDSPKITQYSTALIITTQNNGYNPRPLNHSFGDDIIVWSVTNRRKCANGHKIT